MMPIFYASLLQAAIWCLAKAFSPEPALHDDECQGSAARGGRSHPGESLANLGDGSPKARAQGHSKAGPSLASIWFSATSPWIQVQPVLAPSSSTWSVWSQACLLHNFGEGRPKLKPSSGASAAAPKSVEAPNSHGVARQHRLQAPLIVPGRPGVPPKAPNPPRRVVPSSSLAPPVPSCLRSKSLRSWGPDLGIGPWQSPKSCQPPDRTEQGRRHSEAP